MASPNLQPTIEVMETSMTMAYSVLFPESGLHSCKLECPSLHQRNSRIAFFFFLIVFKIWKHNIS
jgi:hypothetical protein